MLEPRLLRFLVLLILAQFPVREGFCLDYRHDRPYADERYHYDVKFYGIDLQVSDSSTYIQGSVEILIEPEIPALQQVIFDFSNALITDSITVRGQQVTYNHDKSLLTISLSSPLEAGEKVAFRIFYHGLGRNITDYPGIYNKYSSSWDKRITWTLSEPFHAMNWFPCKQVLTDKADSVYVFLSTDSRLKAGSNGLLTAQVPLPEDRIRYEWKSRFPIGYYLISFAVSDYMDYSYYVRDETDSDSILVQNYLYNNTTYLDQNKASIDRTGDMILLFERLFGDYPFSIEKYGHCVAPLGGGMEHQTMTTLASFSFLLVAHELAHQWFGDYVTCSSWQDIWINEGFASYAEYLSSQYLRSQDAANTWISDVHDHIKSAPDGSVYVPEESMQDEDRIFDYRLTYNKGAAILHMIRQETASDSLFFITLQTFLEKYKNGTASGADFRDHVTDITGKDFTAFFDQWYFGQGYPVHSFTWNHHRDTLTITSLQTASSVTPFFQVSLEFKISLNNRDTVITCRQTSNFNTWKIHLPGNVSSVTPDPNHWILMEISDLVNNTAIGPDSKFRIVPNPARERVNVYYTDSGNPYTIYLADGSGKFLYSGQTQAQHNILDISSYAPGLYVIVIHDKGIIHQAKFIIR